MCLAEIPATIEYGATSFVTTAPAPITAPSPIVKPLQIIAPAPIQTSFPIINLSLKRLYKDSRPP